MRPEGICHASGKVGYANEAGAEIMLGYLNRLYADDELDHAYECDDCGAWHLSSHPRAAWVIEHRPSRFRAVLQRIRASFEVWPA